MCTTDLIFFPLFILDLCQFFDGQRFEICRILGVGRTASRTKTTALGSNLVPAKSAYLKNKTRPVKTSWKIDLTCFHLCHNKPSPCLNRQLKLEIEWKNLCLMLCISTSECMHGRKQVL